MADINWGQVVATGGLGIVSGLGGWAVGLWRWGRSSAEARHKVKEDYIARIDALRDQITASMTKVQATDAAARDDLVGQFTESFNGIRRQFDEHKLDVERRFVPKEDFKDFRDEYRQDMRDIKALIADSRRPSS